MGYLFSKMEECRMFLWPALHIVSRYVRILLHVCVSVRPHLLLRNLTRLYATELGHQFMVIFQVLHHAVCFVFQMFRALILFPYSWWLNWFRCIWRKCVTYIGKLREFGQSALQKAEGSIGLVLWASGSWEIQKQPQPFGDVKMA